MQLNVFPWQLHTELARHGVITAQMYIVDGLSHNVTPQNDYIALDYRWWLSVSCFLYYTGVESKKACELYLMWVINLLRMELIAECVTHCVGIQSALLVQERPWSPSSSKIFLQWHFVLSKILAPVWRAVAIRCSSGLSRFPTVAIGNVSDQVAMWLSCAVSNRQWFQVLLMHSTVLSESLQVRTSQAACIPFCSGDESWCSDQASIASVTSPWWSSGWREGSKRLRSLQTWDDDWKHGRDRSAAKWRSRSTCLIGRDSCDLLPSPKDTLCIFSMLVFMAVSNTSSSFLHLKHGALCSKYISLGIERQLLIWKMLDVVLLAKGFRWCCQAL